MRRCEYDLADPRYTPVKLINEVAYLLQCKNDQRLAYALEMEPAMLGRIRHRKVPISDRFMVDIMDRTGLTIIEVRALAGIPFDGARALVVLTQQTRYRFPKLFFQGVDK